MGFKWIVLAATALSAAVAANAAQGDNAGNRRSYEVGRFDSVTAGGPHRVIVTVGGPASVRAEGPAEVLDRMEVVVEDGKLEIRPRREYRHNYGWRDGEAATFHVSLPALREAAIAGSGDMSVDRVEGERFTGSVAGSGNLGVASLRVADASFNIAGSGDLTARGSAGRSSVSIAGSGNARLGEVSTRSASVNIAGSGQVDLNASDEVEASIVGSGDVNVAGTASCSLSRIGSGTVNCASGRATRRR